MKPYISMYGGLMDKYTVDLITLDSKINARKQIKLADVKDKIEKIAFDVVRFSDDSNVPKLWQVQGDYIVAMYDENEEAVTGDWSVESDKLNKSATIFYKNTPLKNIKLAEVGIKEEEVENFKQYLPERLANNKELVKKMINSLDVKYKTKIASQFPELVK